MEAGGTARRSLLSVRAATQAEATEDTDAGEASLELVRTRRVVYGATAAYALLFAAAAAVVYLSFHEQRLDLGDMVQAVWSTAHGHFLQVTTPSGREMSRLGLHADPFLALFAPLWWIWPSPLLLLVVQAVAVASGALPVYWLAREHLGSERAGAHFAFIYLLFPATQYNALTDQTGPHPVSFAVPLILYAIWFLYNDRLLAFAVLALLAASTKEEIPIAVGCLGIWYAVRRGRPLAGATIFVLGTVATLVDILVVIPHYSPTGQSPFAGRYRAIGGTPGGIGHKLVSDPLAFVHAVASWHKLVFVLLLLVPFLCLWALEPLLLLCAAPVFAIDLFSSEPLQSQIQGHYTAGILPFVLAASILGTAKLRHDPARVSFYALAGAALLMVLSPLIPAGSDLAASRPSDPTHIAKSRALELVPAHAPVAASQAIAGYLSARHYISIFPITRGARWIVVDAHDASYGGDVARFRRAARRYELDPHWRAVYMNRGVAVLEKRQSR
jgi:uncharacterized membrane protein